MKKWSWVLLFVFSIVVLVGCGAQNAVDESESVKEENKWKIVSYPAEEPKGEVYHWALLQNQRNSVDEEVMVAFNERMQELGMTERVQMHVVTVEDLLTPEVLQEIKQALGGKMDFVSISPPYMAFSKKDWATCFIDLTKELQTGKLQEFYQTVPPNVWEVNRIAGGQFSFSDRMETLNIGYMFSAAAVEKIGAENIALLQKINGFKEESVWKEIYEKVEDPMILWYGEQANCTSSRAKAEEPYTKDRLSILTSFHDLWYLENLTDDIRFNYEQKQFEWVGHSETYEDLVKMFYDCFQKEYITEKRPKENGEDLVATVNIGADAVLKQGDSERPVMWAPVFDKPRIRTRPTDMYYFSCVAQEAKEGWQQVLNQIGTDEELSLLLNKGIDGRDYQRLDQYMFQYVPNPKIWGYSMLMTDVLYQSDTRYYDCPLYVETEDRYAYLEELYEEAEESALGDFVFNPAPIAKEFEECNRTASLYRMFTFCEDEIEINEMGEVQIMYQIDWNQLEFFWKEYREVMNQKGIEDVVAEINRQYQEWTQD